VDFFSGSHGFIVFIRQNKEIVKFQFKVALKFWYEIALKESFTMVMVVKYTHSNNYKFKVKEWSKQLQSLKINNMFTFA